MFLTSSQTCSMIALLVMLALCRPFVNRKNMRSMIQTVQVHVKAPAFDRSSYYLTQASVPYGPGPISTASSMNLDNVITVIVTISREFHINISYLPTPTASKYILV